MDKPHIVKKAVRWVASFRSSRAVGYTPSSALRRLVNYRSRNGLWLPKALR